MPGVQDVKAAVALNDPLSPGLQIAHDLAQLVGGDNLLAVIHELTLVSASSRFHGHVRRNSPGPTDLLHQGAQVFEKVHEVFHPQSGGTAAHRHAVGHADFDV